MSSYDICPACSRPRHRCACLKLELATEAAHEIDLLQQRVAELTDENDRLNARDGNPRALRMPTLAGMTPDTVHVVEE